ncbi:MAG: DeoR/GlpR family DNA-binding transcription regulator [Ostreibacterium sp.]
MKNNRIQRQFDIINRLREESTVNTQVLAKEFGVSVMTVHRDLTFLEEQGHISKQYGGAVMINRLTFPQEYDGRRYINTQSKSAIGEFAAKHLIDKDDSLVIDSGSTTLAFVKALPDNPMQVMVNSLPALAHLSEYLKMQVYSLGGKLNQDIMAFEGTIASDMLKTCHFSKAFIGIDGINLKATFTICNTANAQLTRLMAEQSKEVYVLADSSKFDGGAFADIMPFEKVTGIISDSIPDAYKKVFLEHHVQIFEVGSYYEN